MSATSEKVEHVLTIEAGGMLGSFRARCSCGHLGKSRNKRYKAREDFAFHMDNVRRAERHDRRYDD